MQSLYECLPTSCDRDRRRNSSHSAAEARSCVWDAASVWQDGSGQAIFVVGQEQDYGVVSFPYEMLPLPEKGMIVDGTDREGQTVCQGEILKVMIAKNFDHTTVVTLKVPLGKEDTVRGFRFREDR